MPTVINYMDSQKFQDFHLQGHGSDRQSVAHLLSSRPPEVSESQTPCISAGLSGLQQLESQAQGAPEWTEAQLTTTDMSVTLFTCYNNADVKIYIYVSLHSYAHIITSAPEKNGPFFKVYKLLFLCCIILKRIFSCDKCKTRWQMQDNRLTPGNVLNILICTDCLFVLSHTQG